MYKQIIRPLFFRFTPEKIHHFSFRLIRFTLKLPGAKGFVKRKYAIENPALEREVFGIKFPNPVGLAAGFDKDAKLYKELGQLGFGFVEIGTVTPKGQPGNPKPRLFRLPEDNALINRMGFNNEGVKAAARRLRSRNENLVIGGNIGKNKVTPNENALDDYMICFNELFEFVDYFVVNVSSPNTPNLRELQDKEPLTKLLIALQKENEQRESSKPILLKIAPDLTNEQLDDIVEIVKSSGIAGVIATNTTISRDGLQTEQTKLESIGNGGLSGKPLTNRSTEVIRYLSEKSGKSFPIVGVGGIHSEEDALEKLDAGADLVQLYTGFIYEGPSLVKRINQSLLLRSGRK
jgi:dihydroorotate dehydrogenase